ncbi:MAG: excinuclease ABC subunit C [Bdellovibrio sp. ArHS]|uniref:exonuclease domain-containing protein n=1 Tax=Bdellovibrio sp. ArHS TaxID=1569284 RepID=UPI000582A07F|nr:exonuclease domain-containing protein [Bdellovibrio sp. ArHS]KHD89831.1 MAG: excinuclease ABC subunit C [Bdellovibrio sp. ArHS]
MSLLKTPVLFLDLQTTGAKPDTAHILEIAWASLASEHIESALIEQVEDVPRRIQFITGIYQKDLEAARPLPQVFADLRSFVQKHLGSEAVAVIHFAQFERPFLVDAYEKLQEEMPFSILCTHEIAKRLLPNLPTRGIKGLAGYFGCPSGELKRAANHVQATQVIWQGLTTALAEKGILSLADLEQWLQDTPKTARVKYEYPLPKEKRLSLPKQPGVYRMISRWGEVLYVGKATSLHDRVNSYFRGQKNRDTRKLEMLTQVWDLQVTPVGSPLEAALLETDEIKRLDPPYNISLKTGRRELCFFNKAFTSFRNEADEEHFLGPFANALALDSILKLSASLQDKSFDENIFYEPMDAALLAEGFQVFCQRHGFTPQTFCSVRSILAVGLNWYRQLQEEEEIADSEATDTTEEAEEDNDTEELLEIELTPEDLADKYERHFIRSAATYLRTKRLTRLLNVHIQIDDKMTLKIQNGKVLQPEASLQKQKGSWKDLSIDTYDRMTVLFTELNKLKDQNQKIDFI